MVRIHLSPPNLGSKVFTDARWLVTPEEGDRYPLEPPSLFQSSTAVVQLTVNQLVVGSIPAFGASFRPFSIMVLHLFCNQVTAVRFCQRAPMFSRCGEMVSFVVWGHVAGVRFPPPRPVKGN